MFTLSQSEHLFVSLYRICKLRIERIALVSRMRCVFFVCAPSTAWRRRSWLLQNTSLMWIRRSSRPECLTRSLQDLSDVPFYRPFWSMRSRMRSEHCWLWNKGPRMCEKSYKLSCRFLATMLVNRRRMRSLMTRLSIR